MALFYIEVELTPTGSLPNDTPVMGKYVVSAPNMEIAIIFLQPTLREAGEGKFRCWGISFPVTLAYKKPKVIAANFTRNKLHEVTHCLDWKRTLNWQLNSKSGPRPTIEHCYQAMIPNTGGENG